MKFRNTKIFIGLLKTQTYNYFTDPINIVLGFLLTSVTMLCWVAFKPTQDSGISTDAFVLASAIGLSSIRNSQYNLNCTLIEWRGTRFIRNISTTPISRKVLFASILCFNWLINILVALVLFALAMLFESQRLILNQIEWTPFLVGFWLNIFLSNIMALFISNIMKNGDYVLIVSGLSYFGPMYLLGLGIPWSTVGQIKFIFYLSYLFPHRYTLHLMQAAWHGNAGDMSFPTPSSLSPSELENWNNSFLAKEGFGYGDNAWWLPAVISIACIIIFLVAFVFTLNKNYRFGLRKYAKYKGVSIHLNHIEMIKKAESVSELKNYIEIAELDKKSSTNNKKDKVGKVVK